MASSCVRQRGQNAYLADLLTSGSKMLARTMLAGTMVVGLFVTGWCNASHAAWSKAGKLGGAPAFISQPRWDPAGKRL
jgi:hypothetical protein